MSNHGIFVDQSFYIDDIEPERPKLVELIKKHGGTIAESYRTDIPWIGTHESTTEADVLIRPQYIYDCDARNQLVPRQPYLSMTPSTGHRRRERRAFSTKDKRILREWVYRVENFRYRGGDTIFQILEKKHPQHTADSWKNHWQNKIEPLLSREEKKRLMTGGTLDIEDDAVNMNESQEDDEFEQMEKAEDRVESQGVQNQSNAVKPAQFNKGPSNLIPPTPTEREADSPVRSVDEQFTSKETTPIATSCHQPQIESSIEDGSQLGGDGLLQSQERRRVLSTPITKRILAQTKLHESERSTSPISTHSEETDEKVFKAMDTAREGISSRKSKKQDAWSAIADESEPLLLHQDLAKEASVASQTSFRSQETETFAPSIDEEESLIRTKKTPHHGDTRSVAESVSSVDYDVRSKYTRPLENSRNQSHRTRPEAASPEYFPSDRPTEDDNYEWENGHQQHKRKARSELQRKEEKSYESERREATKPSKRHRSDDFHNRTPSRTASVTPQSKLQTSHILDAFAIEQAKHIGLAMKEHTYRHVSTVTDAAHRRWLNDLRGLMMDCDKDAIQVLTTLRICSGDWDVGRAFLMRLRKKGQSFTSSSSSLSGQSRTEILMRDQEELTRLMWSQKDDRTLLKGRPDQVEELIERKGRNNTNARRQFLQAF